MFYLFIFVFHNLYTSSWDHFHGSYFCRFFTTSDTYPSKAYLSYNSAYLFMTSHFINYEFSEWNIPVFILYSIQKKQKFIIWPNEHWSASLKRFFWKKKFYGITILLSLMSLYPKLPSIWRSIVPRFLYSHFWFDGSS